MQRFAERVVVVTGGTRGIGRACAERFAHEGAHVVVCGRSEASAAQAAEQMGKHASGYACDVSDPEAVTGLMAKVESDFGAIHVLVNNAGITDDGLLMRMKDETWHRVLQTNLSSVFYCCRACARGMLRQRSGRIINLTSIVGVRGQAGQSNYSAAKAGIIGFTKAYAQEVAPRGITVNAVAPGLIETDMTQTISDEQRQALVQRIPLQRAGRPADIAGVVAFLASDDAAYITGAVIPVDGGLGM